jgi:transaldolase
MRAVADHGHVPADSVRGHYDDAQHVLEQLKALGVDYDDVTATLEAEGVATFDASWQTVGEQVTAALHRQPARQESGQ